MVRCIVSLQMGRNRLEKKMSKKRAKEGSPGEGKGPEKINSALQDFGGSNKEKEGEGVAG